MQALALGHVNSWWPNGRIKGFELIYTSEFIAGINRVKVINI
jgi:hypothetical protein